MTEKIPVREVIIVEGKYDKIRLESLVDGYILQTDGFRIFADPDKQRLIRQLAAVRGILVLTDSDSAGFVIRNFLNGLVPQAQIRHAYIPDILGKEKRKPHASKEGKLGVEGMETEALRTALRRAGVGIAPAAHTSPVTKADLFADGLSGGDGSAAARQRLLRMLQLPENMTTNGMLHAINSFLTRAEYREAVQKLRASDAASPKGDTP